MSSEKSPVFVYDTTLRDGTQGEGISFSAKDKLLIAQRMDAMGFDYIEGGWPGSNPRDMAFFDLAKGVKFQHARLAAFGSTRRANVTAEEDPQLATLVAADTPVVTIFGKTWLLHVTEVLRTTAEENLRMIEDSVRFLTGKGREVIYDAEHFFDGYKDDPEYALATLDAAQRGGAKFLVLCDTNGGSMVSWLQETVRKVVARFPGTPVGMHCHNDCGLGVALSVAGVEAGATMVQGTMNGYGERVGNADLTSIVPNLAFKLDYPVNCRDELKNWRSFSLEIARYANQAANKKAPWVGQSAFAHKGGVHANAAQKVARSYEHIEPEVVGNRQRILLSDMAGGSSVAMKAAELGLEIDHKSPQMRDFLQRLKELENRGYEFENADASFEVLLNEFFHGLEDNFKLVSYRTISEVVREHDEVIAEAVIKLRVNGDDEVHLAIAESEGPVGALDQAARRAFGTHFPELANVRLVDYKVRILQSNSGSDSIVQVLINSSDDEHEWWTCGASPNIIEASWQALRDSYRYKLMKLQQSGVVPSAATPV
ncbi:MAG: 2-isopropylmalate synthase [Puniceicoccaceae bacterium 5H]|nr:MAG: 2-isopropylmalate synthase [Puniceicoccaceae bacterium 5H]